jgi:hypothetical protein
VGEVGGLELQWVGGWGGGVELQWVGLPHRKEPTVHKYKAALPCAAYVRTLRRCGVCVGNSSGVLEATLRSTSVGFRPSQARLQRQAVGGPGKQWHGMVGAYGVGHRIVQTQAGKRELRQPEVS